MENNKLILLSYKLQKTKYVRIISGGLASIIPVLMIGAFSLIVKTFPVKVYLEFIKTFADGFIYDVAHAVYMGTFGILAMYMVIALSYNYAKEANVTDVRAFGTILISVISFCILTGAFTPIFKLDNFGPKAMITALICGYFIPYVFLKMTSNERKKGWIYSDGADEKFNRVVKMIVPIAIIATALSMVNAFLYIMFDVITLQNAITKVVDMLFLSMNSNFGSGFLFVLLSSLLWFFGIHGSDCLEATSATVFQPNIDINISAVASGIAPTEILTKQFFDVFVLMGGCGSAICLLIALLIFGRRNSDRKLVRMSAFPMIFNINEVMIFGLPVILNPVMFIPFILTPLVCYMVAYGAVSLGLVGMTTSFVEWTTPVIMGGYAATGGISGSVLQLVNIALGIIIYTPFVKMMDKNKDMIVRNNYSQLVEYYKEIEESNTTIRLTDLNNDIGLVAKLLAVDLQTLMDEGEANMFYQPQFNYDGKCIGAEALLRWKHEIYGIIYPPLAIKIAEESMCVDRLEKIVIKTVCSKMPQITEKLGADVKVSVNITSGTLLSDDFLDFLRDNVKGKNICLEVTEQTALRIDDYVLSVFAAIKDMGIKMAIDDFSMGQTSITYLKGKQFDLVKLDGGLVKDIKNNPRCLDIIKSIVMLSHTLGFEVLAEYVENEEIRDMLSQVGCKTYQGYLYSKAVPLEELGSNMKNENDLL